MESKTCGFTLVELSIVIVIVALLVGGVLAGRDLIEAAQIRAQITQIDNYRAAAAVFKTKYFFKPGDLPASTASQAGFKTRGASPGQGDGNGIISGYRGAFVQQYYSSGENLLFWTDLSTAGLINDQLTTATATGGLPYATTPDTIGRYFPKAKIDGNFILVTGGSQGVDLNFIKRDVSYFALQDIYEINFDAVYSSSAGLTVSQAFSIDSKVDDGLPFTGKVAALRLNFWTIGTALAIPVPASASTCADNNNNASNAWRYTMSITNGSNRKCTLFFEI